MKKDWKLTTIGNVVDFFDSKRVPLSGTIRKVRRGGYPYYGASGIIDHIDDYIFDGRYLLVAEDGENLNSRKTPIAFFAKGKFWVNNHAHIIRGKTSKVDDYFLLSWFAQANISGYITGAAQPKLSQANLKRIELFLPPIQTQRKIATILSAYDDLIENNLRRIKILEEMAQNLYREWFVKFRFPGYENAKFVDSPLGMIPEGWDIHNIFDEAEVTYGYAFKSESFTTKKIGKPVVRIRDILAGKSDTFSEEEVTERYYIRNGDLLVGMDGDFHMGFWIGSPANLVQRVARFRPNGRMSRYLLFFLLKEPIETFNATISGTTVAHLGHKHISTIQFLIPPDHILRIIDQYLELFLKKIINLRISNETLSQTRDLLLPKLISGEVDVSNLDIEVQEEVIE